MELMEDKRFFKEGLCRLILGLAGSVSRDKGHSTHPGLGGRGDSMPPSRREIHAMLLVR